MGKRKSIADYIRMGQDVGFSVMRNGLPHLRRLVEGVQKPIIHDLRFSNPFQCMHIRHGRVLGVYTGFNDVTVVGKNHLWDVTFGNSTPVTQVGTWYIGLINQSPTPTLSENDTLASHAGWSETTAYSGNRKAWDDTNAASKIKGTTTPSEFTMNSTLSVHGIFIASVSSGTSGILWATGSFDASVPVISSDVLRITYGLRC